MRLNSFLLNSDYPFDQIVFYASFSVVAASDGSVNKTISHSLGFKPLIFGVCATKSDFSDSVGLGEGVFSARARGYSNRVVVSDGGFNAGSTIYIRLYGFAPTNFTGQVPATSRSSKPLLLNTDYEYAPLIFEAAITCATSSGSTLDKIYNVNKGYLSVVTTAATVSVEHDLGYKPSVMTWLEADGYTQLASSAEFDLDLGWISTAIPTVNINNNDFFVETGPLESRGPIVHIRAYADGK